MRQRRQGERGRPRESPQAEGDRPRGRRRRQCRSERRDRGRRPGDEHARRQRGFRSRAHAGADAGHGAIHSAGHRLHQERQVGEEKIPGHGAARQNAGRGRAWQHRTRSGAAGARLRNEDLASDPYVNSQTAADLGVTLVTLDDLYAQSDYITLHVALTTETQGMLNDAAFAKMKKGVRIVNCARGELIDGEALRKAIESGKSRRRGSGCFSNRAAAAGEPLLALENVLATPHIGGSTEEAQEIVGVRIAEQVRRISARRRRAERRQRSRHDRRTISPVRPTSRLAERLGTFAAYVATGNPKWCASPTTARSRARTPC